jgi:Zn finger protein HypA/HybF involved in hydrogenase expression
MGIKLRCSRCDATGEEERFIRICPVCLSIAVVLDTGPLDGEEAVTTETPKNDNTAR